MDKIHPVSKKLAKYRMEYGAIRTPFIFAVYAKSKYLRGLIRLDMGKNKLEKFADMASYPHVFEYPYLLSQDIGQVRFCSSLLKMS